jgi:sulfide:quinone oxidoreductase
MAGPVVCVVGAGTAGLEALLCARERLGPNAELCLIAPGREFRYRPTSRDSPFRPVQERGIAIAKVVADASATWIADLAAVVRAPERRLLTRDGDTVAFDFLLIAAGTRSRRSLHQGYVWERGRDPGFLDQIIFDIGSGKVANVAVVIPRGARWPLPAYELALVIAWSTHGTGAQVTLITVEQEPLCALGSAATEAVARELEAAGVETISGVEVIDELQDAPRARAPAVTIAPEKAAVEADALIGRPTDPARVHVGAGSARQFDRLIALPTMLGPAIAGVPTDAAGFIEVDRSLRIWDNEPVWAAGGCIAAALEHSALSAQQADAAVGAIVAASRGTLDDGSIGAPELTGVLLTGERERWLVENPLGTRGPSTRCLWWPSGRAAGRMLARRIAAWDPAVGDALPDPPDGVIIRAPVVPSHHQRALDPAGAHVSEAVDKARQRDTENRELMAVERREREGAAEVRELSAGLQTLAARQQQVIRALQQHGYLHDRGRPAHRRQQGV